MARVKGGPTTRNRRKKVLDRAEGFYGLRRKTFQKANETVTRALKYAYTHRRLKKREFRALWIQRINAASRSCGVSYSVFMCGLKKSNVDIDRKVLADIAANDFATFQSIADISAASK